MGEPGQPGTGARPGIESQTTAAGLGKPSQVPRDAEGPNPQPYDRSPEAEALRPGVDEGAGDPRAGAGDLLDEGGQPAGLAADDADDGTEGA